MLLVLASPLPMKIAVDSVLEQQPLPRFLSTWLPGKGAEVSALGIAVGLLLAIAVMAGLQGLASWLLQTYVGEKLVWDFRAKLLNHVQRLPLAFHDHYGAGDSVYCIQHDAPAVQYVVIQVLIPLCTSVFTLGGMIFVTIRSE